MCVCLGLCVHVREEEIKIVQCFLDVWVLFAMIQPQTRLAFLNDVLVRSARIENYRNQSSIEPWEFEATSCCQAVRNARPTAW